MGKSSGLLSNNFYEADRTYQKLSHSDFSLDPGFDDMKGNETLMQFLLEKEDWEKCFLRKKSGSVDIDVEAANKIFYTCYKMFKNQSDAVDIFGIITDFYKIDSTLFYWKLIKRCRMVINRDLGERLGEDVAAKFKEKVNGSGQGSFDTHLKNPKLHCAALTVNIKLTSIKLMLHYLYWVM